MFLQGENHFQVKLYPKSHFFSLVSVMCHDVLIEKYYVQYCSFDAKNHHFQARYRERGIFSITFRFIKTQNDNFYLTATSSNVLKFALSHKEQNSKFYF